MKRFKFKYSGILYFLMALVLMLSLAGTGWNIYNIVYFIDNALSVFLYSVTAILSLFIFVLDISVLTYGSYTVDGEYLTAHFGLIKSKSKISDVVEVTHFKKTNKLVVYFSEGAYTVILISPTLYDEFVKALRDNNKKIMYDNRIEGEDTPE